jgi:hypothetical protein
MLVTIMGLLTLIIATNPLIISISIMVLSLIITPTIYKSIPERWTPFVLVITFSTGMIILFLYASSLTSNEVNKSKNKKIIITLMLTIVIQKSRSTQTRGRRETLSSKITIITIASVLLITMLALSIQGYTPNQSIRSSF